MKRHKTRSYVETRKRVMEFYRDCSKCGWWKHELKRSVRSYYAMCVGCGMVKYIFLMPSSRPYITVALRDDGIIHLGDMRN